MKNKLNYIKKIIPWFLLAFSYLLSIAYIFVYGKESMDSDMAAEMILANILNHEGGLISRNWFYSTELHIFTQQPFLQLGLKLFPNDWNLARMLGMSLMLLLFACFYLFLFYVMKEEKSRAVLFTAVLLLPFGFWYMNLVTFGGYYLPYLILIVLGTALIIGFCTTEKDSIKKLLFAAGILAVSFCGGLSGVRYLINLYVPLIAASFVLLFMKVHREPQAILELKCREWKLFMTALAASLCNAFAYLLNNKVLAPRYSFENMTSQTWGKLDIIKLLNMWSNFLSIFGFQNDEYANSLSQNQTSPMLFSLQGLIGVFGILIAAAIIFSIIRLLKRWNALSFEQKIIVALFLSILVIDGMVYAWTEGFESNVTYWVPAVPFAFLILEIEIATEDFSFAWSKTLLPYMLVFCIFCTSYVTIKEYKTEPLRANPDFQNISSWLLENGYSEGYASFWNSNVLTVLSNGKLDVWTVWELGGMGVQDWLQKREHLNPPQSEKVFVVVSPGDGIAPLEIGGLNYANKEVVYTDEFGFSIVALSN